MPDRRTVLASGLAAVAAVPGASLEAATHPVAAGGRVWRVAQQDGRIVSVREFGARGDGTGDDAAAFRAAIRAVSADGGGVVFVPPGVYPLSRPLTLAAQVVLHGAGPASVLRPSEGFRGSVLLKATDRITDEPVAGIGLYQLRLDLHPTSVTGVFGAWTDAVVSGVEIRLGRGYGFNGVYWNSRLEHITVQGDPELKDTQNGFDCSTRDSVLSDIRVFDNRGRSGIWLNASRSTTMSACLAVRCGRAGFGFEKCRGVSVTGCWAVGNGQRGFALVRSDPGNETLSFHGCQAHDNGVVGFRAADSRHVTLSGCIAQGNRIGLETVGASDYFAVVGCDLSRNEVEALRLAGTHHRIAGSFITIVEE